MLYTDDSLTDANYRQCFTLRIVVCVKQVPDVAEIRIDEVKHTLIRTGVPSILNPFDEFAVEEGKGWLYSKCENSRHTFMARET